MVYVPFWVSQPITFTIYTTLGFRIKSLKSGIYTTARLNRKVIVNTDPSVRSLVYVPLWPWHIVMVRYKIRKWYIPLWISSYHSGLSIMSFKRIVFTGIYTTLDNWYHGHIPFRMFQTSVTGIYTNLSLNRNTFHKSVICALLPRRPAQEQRVGYWTRPKLPEKCRKAVKHQHNKVEYIPQLD